MAAQGPLFVEIINQIKKNVISSPDPKYDSDWYETIVGRSRDTGNTFLTDLIDN